MAALFLLLLTGQGAEQLGRGLVAVKTDKGEAFVSWRALASEAGDAVYELYRINGDQEERVALPGPGTNYLDPSPAPSYRVSLAGEEGGMTVELREESYWEIPLQEKEGYRAGDCSLADLDGDGEYEFVVHFVGESRDNGSAGMTSPPILEAYELDGTCLWTIELGRNIREGEHYTQFMVYDLDGDGRAEVACKTADGTRDGEGKIIGDEAADWVNREEGSKSYGRILAGPEFLTIFEGRSGAELITTDYLPGRDPIDGWGGRGGNGGTDSYGNRCDRFLACVAYLDGERPSLVMARGVYGRTALVAWDWREGQLTRRWTFDTGPAYPPYEGVSEFAGMGGHSLAVADVDGDGRDEIVYQAMTVDDDGSGLYSTGRRHGDTLAVGDLDPRREGLELYLVTENEGHTVRWQTPGAGLHDAGTGAPLWTHSPGRDISVGLVANIDPRHPGMEVWGHRTGLRTIEGEVFAQEPRQTDWLVWWDGDLMREIYGGYRLFKWNWQQEETEELHRFPWPYENRRRGRYLSRWPNLTGDFLGDWREEVLLLGPGGKSLRLYTTTIPSEHRVTCLMQDRAYRLSVALQNVVYNKAPRLSYFLE
ncbi:rhamnogalacturonan lyase [Roseibacillus ishigakijimensis]|uniref:Rhamnogalacturonan lyase n=1 Tax=Roseibacillus ishigakijimensis TaxID=454146 RepID=A0A934RPS8_9BACT|nr:rhamnogalacturonan lyase [Roseibacillus ishigakijimensis]MBK1834728.1 rhamnogalacturonan lyase [Roseibacillus ishigakijimensis]